MALIDYYRKYMYGQAPQDLGISGGQRLQEGTTGLFGVGGQAGGGLLNNFQRPDGGAVFDILSNPYVGIGGSLFTAGQRGQSIGQGGMQSVLQGLQFSETASKLEGARRKRQLIKEYADQVPEADKKIFELDPSTYIASMLKNRSETPSLSKEALELYQQGKAAGDKFDEWFQSLNQAQKDLYNKQVKPSLSALEQLPEVVKQLNEINKGKKKIGDTIKINGTEYKIIGIQSNGEPLLEPI